MKSEVIEVDLPLDLIHKLYGLAIWRNCTIDDVMNDILREELEKEKNT